ncbi:MAG: histidine phosphatase family protein [Candidatus Woesearchaeota archaeon]
MRLIIVRHGQTADNVKHILSAAEGPNLNKIGKTQAKKAGEFLKKEKIDVAYSSDMLRAKQTAEILLKFHSKAKLHLVKELRDRDFGTFNFKTEEEAIQETKKEHSNWEDCQFKSGENFKDLQKRVVDFYKKVLKKYPSKTVLLVFHADAIAALIVYLLKKSIYEEKKYFPQNTSITIVEVNSRKCKVELLESLKHLG